jgi:hypothetical protein
MLLLYFLNTHPTLSGKDLFGDRKCLFQFREMIQYYVAGGQDASHKDGEVNDLLFYD